MARKAGLSGAVIKDYLKRFPSAASKTLAIKLYKENPLLFTSVETVRARIRYYRGNLGEENKAGLGDKSFIRENGKPGDPFVKLPEGIKSLNWNVFKILGDNRILKLADLHIPYHDKKAVEIAVEKGLKFDPTIILLNGDITDCFALSKWETDPRERKFSSEIKNTIAFLAWIREKFPKARIIWKHGNHEERFERYMMLKAPELLNVEKFQFESAFDTKNYGVETVKDKCPIRVNKLTVIHGHEYRFVISNPVNPARGLLLRAKANASCDHFHKSSTDSAKNINDKVIATWSSGCLCELHPRYMPLNEWSHGFSLIEAHGRESFLFQNFKIVDGQMYNA